MDVDEEIVETFAGPGGWDEGLAELGRAVSVGIEFDETACATRRAAGHHALCEDVANLDACMFRGAVGFIASPPCQGFSSAGKGAARDLIPEILDAIHRRDWRARPDPDPRVWLIIDLGRWLSELSPDWIALEQVPSVLPIWRAYAELLRSRGYSVWTGVLNAADYGVPQTRERAILMAHRSRPVQPPAATHDREPVDSLFGTLEPWVTMAEALGWGMSEHPAFTVAFGTGSGGADPSGVGGSGARAALHTHRAEGRWVVSTGRAWGQRGSERGQEVDLENEPAPTITGKSGGQWQLINRRDSAGWVAENGERENRSIDEPAVTITGEAHRWMFDRPATTVQGDPRLWPPGHKVNQDDRDRLGEDEANERYGDRAGSDAIRLTIADALVLQSFRPDYPLQGSKTKQFEQVGNALPVRLGIHILHALIGEPGSAVPIPSYQDRRSHRPDTSRDL